MKGLDREELDAMSMIGDGWMPSHWQRDNAVLGRLKKRCLIAESVFDCGAQDCPGHQTLAVTPVGMMVWHAVRTVR